MDPNPKAASLVGETVSHYKVLGAIGAGGMGVVFEAEDLRLGRRVALKFLPEGRGHGAAIERFNREARAASALNHAHICTVYDVGDYRGQPFIVMERMEGHTLRTVIDSGPIPIERVIELGAQLADALEAAHRARIVHRDLKPTNIFVTDRGEAKLLDFGLAKLVEKQAFDPDADTDFKGSDLTNPGQAMGTAAYMSPEQARGQELDFRTDLFSLGVVLYEMATGRPTFPGHTPAIIYNGILSQTPAPPSTINPLASLRFDAIIFRALEKDPALRYQSASDLRSDLKRLLRDSTSNSHITTGASGVAPLPRPKRRAWFLAAALAAAGLLVLGVVSRRKGSEPAARLSVLVGDTANRTGETAFDKTVGELLATSLEQSRFLAVFPRGRVAQVLQMMKRSGSVVDESVGLEICQREGLSAFITSSVSRLGEAYMLLVSIRDANDRSLATARETFRDPMELPSRIDAAVLSLRAGLGESASSIRAHSVPLADVTSASLEAVKFYTTGRERIYAVDPAGAIAMFEKALELDPDFAMAHEYLGIAYQNQGDVAKAEEHVGEAARLVDRVPEAERHKILADLNMLRSNWAEACPHLEVLVQLRPLDPTSFLSLGLCKSLQYDFAGGIADTKHALDMQPTAKARLNLARMEFLSGDARAALTRVNALRKEMPSAQQAHLVAGQSELALGMLDEAKRTFGALVALGGAAEVQGRLGIADLALARGELESAGVEFDGAFRAALRQGNAPLAGRAAIARAEMASAASDTREFARQIDLVMGTKDPQLAFLINRTLLRAGRLKNVGATVKEGESFAAASDKALQALLRAEEALSRKDWDRAIQESDQAFAVDPSILARETRARARARSPKPHEAVALFEDVIERGTQRIDTVDGPGFHRLIMVEWELGTLLDDLGEAKKARAHLEAFLKIQSPSGLGSKAAIDAARRLKASGGQGASGIPTPAR